MTFSGTKKTLPLVALALLGACSGIPEVRQKGAIGKTMSDYLVAEYRDLAAYENDVAKDPPDAEYFVGRAMAAAQGDYVEPTLMNERPLPPESLPDLGRARSALMAALIGRAREPESWQALARAQAMFDCWIERQDIRDKSRPEEIAACREAFAAATKALSPAGPSAYAIFFDTGGVALDDSAREALAGISETMKESPRLAATLIGNTDTKGNKKANDALSLRRAKAVAQELERLGVPAARLSVAAKGEDAPLRLTPDGVDERRNRRVDIVLNAPCKKL